MSVDGRRSVGASGVGSVRWVRAAYVCLGVFLGGVALSGCSADESESDVLEQEDVDDVDLALEEGEIQDGALPSTGTPLGGDPTDDATNAPPGTEEQDPDPHPWFAPGDPAIDDNEPSETPI